MTALILVDLQNDFVERGVMAVAGEKKLIPLINQLQALFDLVVATQDWHPAIGLKTQWIQSVTKSDDICKQCPCSSVPHSV
jgi:nicotinamidase-related amidase